MTVLFDTDPEGDNGAKETLWKLAESGLDVRLGWSRGMHGGRFVNRQPETLTAREWQEAILPKLVG